MLPLIEQRACFVVRDIPRFGVNPLLSFVEVEARPRGAYQQGLDLTLVDLFIHDVKRKIEEFTLVLFPVAIEAPENVAPSDVAGRAHRIVRDLDATYAHDPILEVCRHFF